MAEVQSSGGQQELLSSLNTDEIMAKLEGAGSAPAPAPAPAPTAAKPPVMGGGLGKVSG